jgi:hypothetical protein
VRRTLLAGLCAGALLGAAACGGDDKAAPGNQVDAITAASADIVFQCRSVERGFLSSVNEERLERDVAALVEAADEFDLDATFERPPPAIEPETTLREQIELAIARLDEHGCSSEHAEQLRDAIDD